MINKLRIISIGIMITVTSCSVNINTSNLNVIPIEEKIITRAVPISAYTEFRDAIRHFDFDYINRNEVSEEQRNFVRSLVLSMEGDYSGAKELLATLFLQSEDSLIRENIAGF